MAAAARTHACFVSTWDLVAEAVGRVDDFSNHFRHALYTTDDGTLGVLDTGTGGAPDVFAGADPPEHTLHRKVFFPELVQQRMEGLATEVSAIADGLLDELLSAGRPDAVTGLADPLPMRMISEHVLGFRDVDVARLRRWVFAGSRFIGGRLGVDDMAAVGAEAAGLLPWVTAELDRASYPSLLKSAAAGPTATCWARRRRACSTACSHGTTRRSR